MSNTNTMTATEKQFAKIKTGPETALYLRRYNTHRAKKSKGIRTCPPVATSCSVEIREMNPSVDPQVQVSFRISLESEINKNHR